MPDEFIGDEIRPVAGTGDGRSAPPGAPAVPGRFTWRGEEHVVAGVLESWRETGPCTHGSGERYVHKHWYRLRTTGGLAMVVYFERRARSGRQAKSRWWLYTVSRAAG